MAELLIPEFVTECDHGIVVIEGRGTKATHGSWNPAVERHHLDGDSLYVVAMPSVEGSVAITVYDGTDVRDQFRDLIVLFNGDLVIRSDELVIGDSDGNVEQSLGLDGQSLSIVVLGDSPQFSEKIVIGIRRL